MRRRLFNTLESLLRPIVYTEDFAKEEVLYRPLNTADGTRILAKIASLRPALFKSNF